MIALIGLGNPGQKYENTWHNIGRRIVKELEESLDLEDKKNRNLSKIEYVSSFIGDQPVIFAYPKTFMNESGLAVLELCQKEGLDPEQLVVVHDDADLPQGEWKSKQGGSSGGHNGLNSIDSVIGANYHRFRFGIGRDERFSDLADYVLSQIPSTVALNLEPIKEAVVEWLNNNQEKPDDA